MNQERFNLHGTQKSEVRYRPIVNGEGDERAFGGDIALMVPCQPVAKGKDYVMLTMIPRASIQDYGERVGRKNRLRCPIIWKTTWTMKAKHWQI